MEQNSTRKIVSLHMEPCSYDCPNSNVCYHRRKIISSGKTEEILPSNFRVEMLEKGYVLHESLCNEDILGPCVLLTRYPNYNLTLPYPTLEKNPQLRTRSKQLQVSVYTKEQAMSILNYQKLFLIKDDETYDYTIKKQLWNSPYSYMHFCVDQDWIDKEKLQNLTYYSMLSNTIGTTIDSCATSWIINGRCPYDHGSYVDINFDGTVRSCPFNKNGVPISEVYNGDYDSLFTLKCAPEKCKYSEMFVEKLNGTNEHTSI